MTPNTAQPLDPQTREAVGKAIGRIPSGLFIVTAQSDDHRAGILASWVQQVSFTPPLISIAVGKTRSVLPMIIESRRFGLCQLAKDDKVLFRKFAGSMTPNEDPFLGLDTTEGSATGVPIITSGVGYLECVVTCHIDVDGDHDVFVGQVRNGAALTGEPHVHIRDNGFNY